MVVSWYAVLLLAATAVGEELIETPEPFLEQSLCGRVWVTVHSPERRVSGRSVLDALELNWDFRGCAVPRTIGLFSSWPSSWGIAIATFNINGPLGHVITNTPLGNPALPGGWDRGAGRRGAHCLWPWVGAGNPNGMVAVNCLKIQPTWMQDHGGRINRLRIGDLAIAGTHNAGAWRFNTENNNAARDNFVLCQDRSIWAQLVHGIRHLDFRIGFYSNFNREDDRYWLNHNQIRIRPLVPLLREIRTFLDSTSELVFLDLHHFPVGFANSDGTPNRQVHRGLLNIVQRELGRHIAPWNRYAGHGARGPTVQVLLNANQRLHISYIENTIVNENNWLWPRLPHLWAQTNNPNQLFTFLNRAISTAPPPNSRSPLHAAMAQTTPTALDIMLLRGSLRVNADIVNRQVTLHQVSVWRRNVNIIASDFFLGNDVVDTSIVISLERAR